MQQMASRSNQGPARMVFGAFVRPQTYLNVLYLLLAFPLGLAYFVFLVVGLSVGFGLVIIWVGLPILLLVLAGSWVLTVFEREMAIRILKQEIPPMTRQDLSEARVWTRVKAHLANRVTWTGMLYLLVKFPLGVASFVLTVVLVYLSLGFLSAPITYRFTTVYFGSWDVDTLGEAFVLLPIGLLVGIVTPHVLNAVARISARFASLMLGDR